MSKELNRYRVMRSIAEDKAFSDIAEEFGVPLKKVRVFAKEYAEIIAELKEDIGVWKRPEELWVSEKPRRLEEYQKDIDRIEGLLKEFGWEKGMQAEKAKLMRYVADECGHLPTRGSQASEEGKTLNYAFEDIDLKDMT